MSPKPRLAIVLMLSALAAPARAQNTAAEPPVIAPPPPTKTETPAPAPPPTTAPAPTPETPSVVVVPAPAPAPPEPVTIDPDVAYPNGFADPVDPDATNVALDYEQRGFDWGLLGLLGLFGLIPLFRDRGGRRVVYVERDEELPPRRVVREERSDGRD